MHNILYDAYKSNVNVQKQIIWYRNECSISIQNSCTLNPSFVLLKKNPGF